MKVIKKNVYYCDYCKKKSLRSVKIHEKHCTANPNRACRLCGRESIKKIIDKYKSLFIIVEYSFEDNWEFGKQSKVIYSKEFTLNDIKNELEYNCPMCLLAIIRCVGLNRFYFDNKFNFDFQEELKEWWDNVNEEDESKYYY